MTSENTDRYFGFLLFQRLIEKLTDDMKRAGEAEKALAIARGDVDADGVPYITVVVDAGWSHRSHGHRYSAKSGCAVVVGKATGKLLSLNVRNKYCYICAVAERSKRAWPEHTCYKNWEGSSSAMEPDMIVQSFIESEEVHGLRYKKFIGDGDSSVFSHLQEKVLSYGRQIIKVECVNHLLKNVTKRLFELQKGLEKQAKARLEQDKAANPSQQQPKQRGRNKEKEFLTNNRIKTIGKTVRRMIKTLSLENAPRSVISEVIQNLGRHCIGDHSKCQQKFCDKSGVVEKNELATDFVVQLSNIISGLTRHTTSIMEYQTTNKCESFMHLGTKFNGSKDVFYCRRGSYTYRTFGAGHLFQHGHGWRGKFYRHMTGKSPGSHMKRKDIMRTRRCIRHAGYKLEKRQQQPTVDSPLPSGSDSDPDSPDSPVNPSADYGVTCRKPDMPEEEIKKQILILTEALKVDEVRRAFIEEITRGQSDCDEWFKERLYRCTASLFGYLFKRAAYWGVMVYKAYYAPELSTPAINWGKDNEDLALQKFVEVRGLQVTKCGLFVDLERSYLAASPDALVVGQNSIVEIKCPYSARLLTIREAAIQKKDFYLKIDSQTKELYLKQNHIYYYQIQGELAITGRKLCYFVVWTPLDVHIEEIKFNQSLWADEMLPVLDYFFKNHLAVEIVDPRRSRKMPLRDTKEEEAWYQKRGLPVPTYEKRPEKVKKNQKKNPKKNSKKPQKIQKRPRKRQGEVSDILDDCGVQPLDCSVEATDSSQSVVTIRHPPRSNPTFLINAHLVPDQLLLDNRPYHISNTCAFDSVVSIIARALQENARYHEEAKLFQDNPVMSVAFLLIEGLNRAKIHEARGKVIVASQLGTRTANGEAILINCEGFMDGIAAMFETAPSLKRKEVCLSGDCGWNQELGIAYVNPEIADTRYLQVGAVQCLVDCCKFQTELSKICSNCKATPTMTYFKMGIHVLLMVDTYSDGSLKAVYPDHPGRCRIVDMDTSIVMDRRRYV